MTGKILISTIVRNKIEFLDLWYQQLQELCKLCPNKELYLAVYENDSTDGTKEKLKSYSYNFVKYKKIISENLGTNQYSSIWNKDRLKNLAYYRQRTLEMFDIYTFDHVAIIEVDMSYSPMWAQELINQVVVQPDIYSGWSLRTEKIPKCSDKLYDTSATRQTEKDLYWDFDLGENKCTLINKEHAVFSLWSTFNGFCVYKAKPFQEGAKFSSINPRLIMNPHLPQPYEDYVDVDTVCICEEFRLRGYNKIYLTRDVMLRHLE